MAGERVPDSSEPIPSGGLDAELGQSVPTVKPLAYAVLFTGEVPDRIFSIRSAVTLLGRADDAHLTFNDPSISLHHARIVMRDGAFEIVDLDSTNGTFVRGKRTSRSPLRNADHVTLGNVDFVFLLDRPSMATIKLPDRIARTAVKGTAALVSTIVPPLPAQARRPNEDEEGPSLADVLAKVVKAYIFIRERALFIGALAVLGAVLGILSLFVVPPGVSAISEVRLLPHMTLSSNPNEDPWQNSERDSGQFVKGAERTLVQPDLVRATLREIKGGDPPDALVALVAGKIKVEETGDHMFRATYKDKTTGQPSPQKFLELHIRNYVQSAIERSLGELNAKVDFLRNQLKAVEGDVDRVSGERATYREANVDRLPEDAQQTQASRFDLETRRTELSSQLHQQEAALTAAEDQLKTDRPEAQRRFQWSESYRQSLIEVNRKLSEAYSRGLGEGHPEVQALKEERRRLEALAKAELQSTTSPLARESDPTYQSARSTVEKLRAEVAATRASLGETEKSLGQVQRVVRALPRVEQHLSELDHRQEGAMQLRADLFSKLKQAEIQFNLEKVSAESRYEVSPLSVERSRNRSTLAVRGGLGVFLGLLAAAIVIALGEAKRLIAKTMASHVVLTPTVVARRARPVSKRP